MKTKYSADTDTAMVKFSDAKIFETVELSENVRVDLDKNGNMVNMTIKNAKQKANTERVSSAQIDDLLSTGRV